VKSNKAFRRADPDHFCVACRRETTLAVRKSESTAGEIKLGSNRILRISVIGDVVTLMRGRIEPRYIHERDPLLANSDTPGYRGVIASSSPMFVVDCSPITVPLRLLDTLRDALAQIAEKYPLKAPI
jgi:hypothetical protein